jgi:hypothetical protein
MEIALLLIWASKSESVPLSAAKFRRSIFEVYRNSEALAKTVEVSVAVLFPKIESTRSCQFRIASLLNKEACDLKTELPNSSCGTTTGL